ncbi:MAG: sulfotransferase family 2 domain-containing protein [Rhodospirillales bacterium]|nr:sulfotransferase family 2 domain-containing protein [Rhodospirillales bacterium]
MDVSAPTDEPFYLFLHIHKTAGTTLRYIVDQQFGPENVITYCNQPSIQLLENLDAMLTTHPNYRAVIGHFKYGLHKKVSGPTRYITFLRHPVARTISQYKESLINQRERLEGSDGKIMSLAESVAANPEYYSDYQANYLVGDDFQPSPVNTLSGAALDNLGDNFAAVGLVEYFDQSVALMSAKLGWEPAEYPIGNVKNIEVEVTAETIEQIISINKSDLAIYEVMKSKLLCEFESSELAMAV